MDESFVRRAVGETDLNALRMALYQATGDSRLAEMKLERVAVRGGATSMVKLAPEHHQEVIEKAVAYLMSHPVKEEGPPPGDEELRSMMEILTGTPLTDREFAYQRHFVAFEEFPFGAEWTDGRREPPPGFSIAIIGAGFSGIAAGVQFERLGIPYTIYERRHEVGGTWSINTYPDVRVDTSSFTYQFSFEKNYPWSEYFASGTEVRQYLEYVAKKYHVFEHIRFGCDVRRARFDETSSTWELELTNHEGGRETVRSTVVVTGTGLFSVPRELDIEGADSFRGDLLHTTRWEPDRDVTGKRVAIIGNGSTGVQMLSKLSQEAAQVYVYQRTPQWISPRENYGRVISPETRWLFDTMPYYWNWYCGNMVAMGLGTQSMQEVDPNWQKPGSINEANEKFRASLIEYIKKQVDNRPDLVERLIPDYSPMSRRLVVDNNWYRSLLRDNVELVIDKIERITPNGIVTSDGKERAVDVIAAAIGFSVTKYLWPTEYRGVGGARLEDAWDTGQGPQAYLGMTVPGFPNLFILYGPNSQPRSNSIPSWIEVWVRYIARAVIMMIEGGHRRLEVRREVFESYNEELDRAARKLIWNDPASRDKNYYVHESGRQQVSAPWRVDDYHARLFAPNPDDFHLR